MSLFSNRIQVVVIFCGSTCGNSPGRFRPAITLHIEQLPPAAKHRVTTKTITKNILNNIDVCIFEFLLSKIKIDFFQMWYDCCTGNLRLSWVSFKLIVYIWLSLFYWNQFRCLWLCTSFDVTHVLRKKYCNAKTAVKVEKYLPYEQILHHTIRLHV